MKSAHAARYFLHAPVLFNRLHGPWPVHCRVQETLHENVRSSLRSLRESDALHWYTKATGNAVPRINRRNHAGFGLMEIWLTAPLARELRKRFPDLHLIRDRMLRITPRSSPAGVSPIAGLASFWHLDQTGVTAARAAGWASSGHGVTVAVIDSGIDASHAEFAGKNILSMAFGPDGSPVDVSAPTQPHGTHVAALIGGKTVGLAPEADLVDIQAFPEGVANVLRLVKSLWAAAATPNVRIINLSAGLAVSTPDFEPIFNQLAASGIVAVCAAGNRRTGVDCPANYAAPVSAGAMNQDQTVRELSGSGMLNTPGGSQQLPDVIAPGEDVLSAGLKGEFLLLSGTSQATAIVSGLAALRISDRNGDISAGDLLAQILTHTHKIADTRAGNGVAFYNKT